MCGFDQSVKLQLPAATMDVLKGHRIDDISLTWQILSIPGPDENSKLILKSYFCVSIANMDLGSHNILVLSINTVLKNMIINIVLTDLKRENEFKDTFFFSIIGHKRLARS